MQEFFFSRSEWLGIEFADLDLPLDPTTTATPDFYDALYAELGRRHSSIDDLPVHWRATKRETAACLAQILDPSERILSFGAGIGNVEATLVDEFGFDHLYLWDPAQRGKAMHPQAAHRFLGGSTWPEPEDDAPFDAICLIQVMHVWDHGHAVDALSRLRALLSDTGRLIMFSGIPRAADIPPQGAATKHYPSTPARQGWGWCRDAECHEALCLQAGLPHSKSFVCAGQSVTIASARASLGP